MVGVGEFEQFDGRAVFDYERYTDAVGRAIGRNQDFAASKLGGEISHFKRDVRNLPDEIGDRRVRFETHPLHAKFAFLVADDKEFQVLQVGLARLRFSSGNSDVMVPAHCFRSPWNWHKFYAVVTAFETAPGFGRHRWVDGSVGVGWAYVRRKEIKAGCCGLPPLPR